MTKKLLSMLLAIVMVFGFAAPAMAGIMCEYFSIFCHSIMPPPVHCPNLKGVKI